MVPFGEHGVDSEALVGGMQSPTDLLYLCGFVH
jgi:hypothetical protein